MECSEKVDFAPLVGIAFALAMDAFAVSVATSIDALAVGLSFAMRNISIWFPVLIIGCVAAVFSAAGIQIGRKIGKSSYLCSYAEGLGGIVLIGIGLNTLREHGAFDAML